MQLTRSISEAAPTAMIVIQSLWPVSTIKPNGSRVHQICVRVAAYVALQRKRHPGTATMASNPWATHVTNWRILTSTNPVHISVTPSGMAWNLMRSASPALFHVACTCAYQSTYRTGAIRLQPPVCAFVVSTSAQQPVRTGCTPYLAARFKQCWQIS
eukprot:365325-Chlamydomonas_euryale.AAC.29